MQFKTASNPRSVTNRIFLKTLSAARSRIQDTDFAQETANITKMQILQQASQSILSQANQRPQVALSLLG